MLCHMVLLDQLQVCDDFLVYIIGLYRGLQGGHWKWIPGITFTASLCAKHLLELLNHFSISHTKWVQHSALMSCPLPGTSWNCAPSTYFILLPYHLPIIRTSQFNASPGKNWSMADLHFFHCFFELALLRGTEFLCFEGSPPSSH